MAPGHQPLVVDAALDGLTPRISGHVLAGDLDGDPATELEPTEVALRACADAEGDKLRGAPVARRQRAESGRGPVAR